MGGEPFPFMMDAAGSLYPAHPPHPAAFGPHPGDGGYYDPSALPFGGPPPFPHDGGEQPPAMEGEPQEEYHHGPWPPAPMAVFGPYAGAPPTPPMPLGPPPHPLHRARSVDAILPGNGKAQATGGKGPSGVNPAGPVPALPLCRVASGNTLANVGAGSVMGMGSPPPFMYGWVHRGKVPKRVRPPSTVTPLTP